MVTSQKIQNIIYMPIIKKHMTISMLNVLINSNVVLLLIKMLQPVVINNLLQYQKLIVQILYLSVLLLLDLY